MALSCSRLAGNPPALVLFVTTQGKRPAFAGNLPGLCIQFRSDDARKIILRLLQQDPPRGRAAVRAALRRRAPAPPAGAIATGAAAVTPQSVSSSLTSWAISKTVAPLRSAFVFGMSNAMFAFQSRRRPRPRAD